MEAMEEEAPPRRTTRFLMPMSSMGAILASSSRNPRSRRRSRTYSLRSVGGTYTQIKAPVPRRATRPPAPRSASLDYMDVIAFTCPHCTMIPTAPVTSQCGHTCCWACLEDMGPCPCGKSEPQPMVIDILVRSLIEEQDLARVDTIARTIVGMRTHIQPPEPAERQSRRSNHRGMSTNAPTQRPHSEMMQSGFDLLADARLTRPMKSPRLRHISAISDKILTSINQEDPLAAEIRYQYARQQLMASGHWGHAAMQLKIVSLRCVGATANMAKNVVTLMMRNSWSDSEVWRIAGDVFARAVQATAKRWARGNILECVLCFHVYRRPVASPCGHTFCRDCIERTMDFSRSCPLCHASLDTFNVDTVSDSQFLIHAIRVAGLKASMPPDDDARLPLLVCTATFPSVACPIFVVEPQYRLMIRRCLRSGSRLLGILPMNPNRRISNYGTIVEICDCVLLESGSSIITCIGKSRFKLMQRDVRDGYSVARIIQCIVDEPVFDPALVQTFQTKSMKIRAVFERWWLTQDIRLRNHATAAFGHMPSELPINSLHGPAWLWWVLTVLPINNELKTLVLPTTSVFQRLNLVERILSYVVKKNYPLCFDPLYSVGSEARRRRHT